MAAVARVSLFSIVAVLLTVIIVKVPLFTSVALL
jgi:hypothetical protein